MSKLDINEIFADEHEQAYDIADARITELLNNEYSPYKEGNIIDCICNEEVLFQKGGIERMVQLMEDRDMVNLGRFVYGRILEYWENKAEVDEAESRSYYKEEK